jgi:hypothetical protein
MLSVNEEKSNEDYLKKCKITENDPAVIFDWNFEVLQQFVDGANQNVVVLPQAFFITTAPGNMTVTSLLNDLMILLSRVSGGRNGNNLLAPNTLSQYGNILLVLGQDIQMNSWVQQLFARFIPVGSFLATVSQIIDRRIANATPAGLIAPQNQGFRQVFQ